MKTFRAVTSGRTQTQYFRNEENNIVTKIRLQDNGKGFVFVEEKTLQQVEKEATELGDVLEWVETDNVLANDFIFMMNQMQEWQALVPAE